MFKATGGAINDHDPNLDFQTIGPDGYAGVENQVGPMDQSFTRADRGDSNNQCDWCGDATETALYDVEFTANDPGNARDEMYLCRHCFETMFPDATPNPTAAESQPVEAEYARDWNEPGGGDYTKVDALQGQQWQTTAATEDPDPCEYGPDVYGELTDDSEDLGVFEVPVSAIRGSAVKKEWPSFDDEATQHFLDLWAAGDYDAAEPINAFMVDDDLWVWDGHSRYTMLHRVNPDGTMPVNVTRRFRAITPGGAISLAELETLGREYAKVEKAGFDAFGPCPESRDDGFWVCSSYAGHALEHTYVRSPRVAEYRELFSRVAGALDGDTDLVVDGDPADPDELTGWATYEKTEPTEMVQVDEPFTVETLEGPMNADAGDFLARGPEGELYPIDGDIQGQTYKRIALRRRLAFTLRQVSEAISQALGGNYELVRGDGYFWISGPGTSGWYTSSISVNSLQELTMEQWVAEARRMKDKYEHKNSDWDESDPWDDFGSEETAARRPVMADNAPTGMFSWEGGQPNAFPEDEVTMPNSANPNGVNPSLTPEIRTDPARVRRAARTQPHTAPNPIADGLRMAARPVVARRRLSGGHAAVLAEIQALESRFLPEQIARYRNMLNMGYPPEMVMASIETDKPLLLRT